MPYSQDENNQNNDKNNSSTFYDLWKDIKRESSTDSNQELLEEIPEDEFFSDANLDVHINASYKFHHAIVSDALQNRLVLVDFIDTTTNGSTT